MLRTLHEFRWYFLSVPIAALMYGLTFVFAPAIRQAYWGEQRAQIMAKVDNQRPVAVEVVQNMPTTVRLSPDSLAVKPGADFSVEVWLSSAYTTRGTQFGLTYDPKLIEVTKVVEGEYYRPWASKNKAQTVLVPSPSIDQNLGAVHPFAIAIFGGPNADGPTGSAVLATIQGRAKSGVSGLTTLRLESVEVSAVEPSSISTSGTVQSVDAVAVADSQIAVGDNAVPPTPLAARTATPHMMPNAVQ